MSGTAINNSHYIVLSVTNRKYDFAHPAVLKDVTTEINFRHSVSHEIDLHLCVIFPKELHIVLSITGSYGKSLKNWVTAYKRYISRTSYENIIMKWTPGFAHEEIKTVEELKACIDKIMMLPASRGIIPDSRALPYILAFP